MLLHRYPQNPILKPNPKNSWENYAVFNGTIIKNNNEYFLFYRAMGNEQTYKNRKLRLSTIGKAKSHDGLNFFEREPFIKPEYDWERYGCEDPRITKIDNKYLIFYTALANYPPNYLGIKSAVAISSDLKNITEKHLVTPFNAKAMTIFPEKINGLYTVLLTVNTDKPPSFIAIAQFKEFETLWDPCYWEQWYKNLESNLLNLRRVNSDQVEIGAPPIKTDKGWLLIYSYIKHYLSDDIKKIFRIEAALLDINDPQKIVGRIESPLLTPEEKYETNGQIADIVFPEGALIEDNLLKVYYGGADFCCATARVVWSDLLKKFETNAPETLKSQKFSNNPLLEPIPESDWENKGVFNSAAIELEGKAYLVYRALSDKDISNFGLAVSDDGYYIDERLKEPIYPLCSHFEKPKREGLPGGVEDARIIRIGEILYMCFTAHDGELARLGISKISVSDFLARRWDRWSKTKIISAPGIIDKDGAFFPEKIDGKYVFFHRIEPDIVIDYVDDLEFKTQKYLRNQGIISPRGKYWDGLKIGINGPPIKTSSGWLVFYHGISKIDHHYRIGALLLDLLDVTKVIGRTSYPILEPETAYEREGIVDNVVFSCGHVQKGDEIIIYYGGADKVVCGAKININELIDYILKSSQKKYLT